MNSITSVRFTGGSGTTSMALAVAAALGSALLLSLACANVAGAEDDGTRNWPVAHAQVIATGIPGAGAVAEVGDFLPGSPLHDKAAFTVFTQAGQVLEAKRVLVASTSNFGAPLARPGEPEGSVLSIDALAIAAGGNALAVPTGFASAGGQASTAGGAVQVYAAQSPSFLNSVTEPLAVTAGLPSASLPLGISINNGNGRPWIANAPNGAHGDGTITVLDPQGYPLGGAPDPVAGGVFAGNLTNRNAMTTHGLTTAALGTAIITKSPELTGRAVFAAVEADGSVVQVNVQKGVDGLAPPGTLTPLAAVDRSSAESALPRVVARAGLVFNWVPTLNLILADPQANRLVVLDLADNGTLFTATRREIRREEFNEPVDLAPATREVSSGSFASNTTLAGGSDVYVLNRGDNTVLRMSIDGRVRGGRAIDAGLPGMRVNGVAVSSDGQTLYITATLPNSGGVLLSMPAFGTRPASADLFQQALAAGTAGSMTDFGTFVFNTGVSLQDGLGPFFNDTSCAGCHSSPAPGGMGLLSGQSEQLVGRIRGDGSFDDLAGHGGPVARAHSVAEVGAHCDAAPGVPQDATVVSLRNAMTLRGDGLIDTIAAGDILANQALEPVAVQGRANVLADGRVGKFGWKADVPTAVEFMAAAFRNEIGVTNPLFPRDETHACGADHNGPDVDALVLQAAAKFLNGISPPPTPAACAALPGAAVFAAAGCASCHTPTLPGPGARQPVHLYSDLLIHHMGPALADMLPQGSAAGDEWRTMPLWRVVERGKFLHDGRAATLPEAVLAHDGQGRAARNAFATLDPALQQDLVTFLNCL